MVKIGLWVGAPPLVTFLFSSPAVRADYSLVILTLALISLFMGFGPPLDGRDDR